MIVVDGANRERMWQAHTPVMDRLAREGTEYLGVEPAHPARTVVCFSSMLTGASPAEHGMRSNFAPRLGVRTESVFDVLEAEGRSGRLVGIAHLLDPFGEDVVRSVTSVQPTSQIDASLCAEGRRVVEEEDPDLLVLQLLAADQLGHVRGVRNREYLEQMADSDRHVGDFLAFLAERGKLDGATVVLMADHGQGRGIGGHGHLDWGERPVPFVVWGGGASPGGVSREPHSVCELAATVSALLGVRAPAAARGRPLVPTLDSCVEQGATAGRALAVVVARNEEPRSAACSPGCPAPPAGCRWTCCWWTTAPPTAPPTSAASSARGWCPTSTRAASAPGCAPVSSSRATRATPPPCTWTATASTTRRLPARPRPGGPRAGRLRDRLPLPRRARRG